MKKKTAPLFLLFFVFLLLIHIPLWQEDIWDQSLKKISSMVSLIENNYFREVNHEELMYSTIRGMLQTLDPHSYFLEPRDFSRMKEEYQGKYAGLGILIQKQEDRLVVISPIEGTPAYRLGIQAGDIISHIEGKSTKPISSFEAMQKLRGLEGTKVHITIVREGLEKPLELTIVREEIPLYSVPYAFMLQDDIGYIFIRNFAETTAQEFQEKMTLLANKGMKKLILDLRGNTGGTFAQSIELSDDFLPKGALIVSIKGRKNYYNQEFYAREDNQHERIPLVILINQGSASAPEILSGAVKDNDRGLIVGEDSWGKGLVQTVFPLAPNTAVALTTARYYTPSGRSIQRDYTHVEDYLFKEDVPESKREVKYTVKGRKVLGQGGIEPDYEVKFSFKTITASLLLKGAFFSYGRKFAEGKTPLAQQEGFFPEAGGKVQESNQRMTLNQNFVVDSRVLDDFKSFLLENKIAFDDSQFKEAQEEIQRELEREIYSSLWGIEEGLRIYRRSDPVVLKAISVFPEAEALIKENK